MRAPITKRPRLGGAAGPKWGPLGFDIFAARPLELAAADVLEVLARRIRRGVFV